MPSGAVWDIDIAQSALKAVKLRKEGEQIELVAFDVIEHPKILSQPDAEPEELIRAAIDKFLSRNDWQRDQFVLGVPGQQTFARFTKLPPVDPKKIPDIVKFEASQQIPFDMDEVVWDYQVFSSPDSPDVEVGIFAIKKDLIRKHLDYLTSVGIAPIAVQTHPCALYNFCKFDQWDAEQKGATVIVDIGAANTDLVIAEANSAWSRNIPLGGNNFTEALVKSFKLSFAKAESLKKTAATSKYARQIFQAMRPVFADLVAEIQRSLGFYSQTHRDVELTRVLGLGNAFRLPGLQKYLENNLTIPGGVHKLEKFNHLAPSATLNAPQFTENLLSFGVSYGLALQGLTEVAISASLLPTELARVALWNKKRPYFVAAAASLGIAAVMVWGRNFMDQAALASGEDYQARTQTILNEAGTLKQRFQEVSVNTDEQNGKVQQFLGLHKDKRLVPAILAFVHEALPEPEPAELSQVRTAADLKKLIATDKLRFARTNRKQVFIDDFSVKFVTDIDNHVIGTETPSAGGGPGFRGGPRAMGEFSSEMEMRYGRGGEAAPESTPPEGATGAGGFAVKVTGRLLYGKDISQALRFVETELAPRIAKLGQRKGMGFHVMEEDPKANDPNDPASKRNVRIHVTEYYPKNLNPMAAFQPAVPGAEQQQPGAEKTSGFVDPVTEEDMSTDWKFEAVFKIKLGEAPEKPPADQAQTPGG